MFLASEMKITCKTLECLLGVWISHLNECQNLILCLMFCFKSIIYRSFVSVLCHSWNSFNLTWLVYLCLLHNFSDLMLLTEVQRLQEIWALSWSFTWLCMDLWRQRTLYLQLPVRFSSRMEQSVLLLSFIRDFCLVSWR